MTKRTARIAEVLRRSNTPDGFGFANPMVNPEGGCISNDIDALRRKAVENVKRHVIARHAFNSVVDEWHAAKEEHKKWSLRK
jgi:hypothetical protein